MFLRHIKLTPDHWQEKRLQNRKFQAGYTYNVGVNPSGSWIWYKRE